MQLHRLLERSIRVVLVAGLAGSCFLPVASAQAPPPRDPPARRVLKANPFTPPTHRTADGPGPDGPAPTPPAPPRVAPSPPPPPTVCVEVPQVRLVGIVASDGACQALFVEGQKVAVAVVGDRIHDWRVSSIQPGARCVTLTQGTHAVRVRLPRS